MKIAIILCSALALATCGTMKAGSKLKRNSFPTDFVDMVKSYGYPVESYEVQTEDGYILELFRIPQGRMRNSDDSSASSQEQGDKKRVVFLMHGLMTNAESFIYGGPSESMAMYLADEGYDVFLGNARGTTYGQRHTTLNPQKDAAFWRFCWNEIGSKDIPALVDKTLSVSGAEYISYIGHNEGTTAFYVMTSEMPEYNQKFDRHISLGPMAYMQNSKDEIIENIENHMTSKAWIMKNLGMNSFSPTNELIQEAETKCLSQNGDEKICKNAYFLFNGWNSEHFNMTTINQIWTRLPSSASVREILHFVQLTKTGRFEKYSEDTEQGEYDLSQVTVPIAIFYTPNDPFYSVDDVTMFADKLPNVYMRHNFEQLNNNVDLLWSKETENVYEKVKEALQTVQNRPSRKDTM